MLAIGLAIKGASGAAKVMGQARKFKQAPTEMTYTIDLLQALMDPMQVVVAFGSRQESLGLVQSALTLASRCIGTCSLLLQEPPDKDSTEAWSE